MAIAFHLLVVRKPCAEHAYNCCPEVAICASWELLTACMVYSALLYPHQYPAGLYLSQHAGCLYGPAADCRGCCTASVSLLPQTHSASLSHELAQFLPVCCAQLPSPTQELQLPGSLSRRLLVSLRIVAAPSPQVQPATEGPRRVAAALNPVRQGQQVSTTACMAHLWALLAWRWCAARVKA